MPPRLANRYTIDTPLGQGSAGRVYRGRDDLTGSAVAIKVLRDLTAPTRRRWRREIAALRLLALPGVVSILDEGEDDGLCFSVTELVPGLPFPGNASGWTELAGLVSQLLRILAGVHAAGLIHRDLKPANVLVHRGSCTVLDFDLASGTPLGRLGAAGGTAGTPRWCSPEQADGREATPASDMYAVGAMTLEALTGRVPHDGDPCTLLRARATEPCPPSAGLCPDLPPGATRWLDSLLALDPRDRPRTAAHARMTLSEAAPPAELPWMGAAAFVDDIVHRVLAGARVDLCGPPRSGRSRCLAAMTAALGARGISAIHASWGEVPGPTPGAVVLVDDADHRAPSALDAWKRSTPTGYLGLVAVWTPSSAPPSALPIPRLTVADLLPVLRGVDRILHEREDAALALLDRSGGLAGRIADELTAWLDRGLALRDDTTLELVSGVPPAHRGVPAPQPVGGEDEDLLGWIGLAEGSLPAGVLAMAAGLDAEALVPRLHALAAGGHAWEGSPGQWWTAEAGPPLSAAQRADRHRRLALAWPPQDPRRLVHRVAAGDDGEAAAEAGELANVLIPAGRMSEAWRVLTEGLRAARRAGDPQAEERLLPPLLRAAFLTYTPRAADLALYEIEQGTVTSPLLPLARALRAMFRCEVIDPVPSFVNPQLERIRHAIRLVQARRGSLDEERSLLDEIGRWVEQQQDPGSYAVLASWTGRLRYREGRFEEGAALQVIAAAHADSVHARLSARLNQAAALLEAGQAAVARDVAKEAGDEAQTLRQSLLEGRAAWLQRAAIVRCGGEPPDDPDLLIALDRLGLPDLIACARFTEAVIRWTAGDRDGCAAHARLAVHNWSLLDQRWFVMLASALLAAAERDAGAALAQVDAAMTCPIPGLALQSIALAATITPAPVGWRDHARTLVTALGHGEEHRLEVLSIGQALRILEGEPVRQEAAS